jgi:hypothetical protein
MQDTQHFLTNASLMPKRTTTCESMGCGLPTTKSPQTLGMRAATTLDHGTDFRAFRQRVRTISFDLEYQEKTRSWSRSTRRLAERQSIHVKRRRAAEN